MSYDNKENGALSLTALENYIPIPFKRLNCIPSTNTYAKEQGVGDGSSPFLVIADEQTGGRGRLGRSFYSEKGTGLYLSIVLFPKIAPDELQSITTAAAVSLCRAISSLTDLSVQIKWVNDVYLGSKKIAGILTEGCFDASTGMVTKAVLGVGVNVFEPKNSFPQDISHIAGSLFSEHCDEGEKKHPYLRERLAGAFVREFMRLYDALPAVTYFEDYESLMFLTGRQVSVIKGDDHLPCTVLGLNPDFSLRVQYPDGKKEDLISGEVSLKIQ